MPPAAAVGGLIYAGSKGAFKGLGGTGRNDYRAGTFQTDKDSGYDPHAADIRGSSGMQDEAGQAKNTYLGGSYNSYQAGDKRLAQGDEALNRQGEAANLIMDRAQGRNLISKRIADANRQQLGTALASDEASARGPGGIALASANRGAAEGQGLAGIGQQEQIASEAEQRNAELAAVGAFGENARGRQSGAGLSYGAGGAQGNLGLGFGGLEEKTAADQAAAKMQQQQILTGSYGAQQQTNAGIEGANAANQWNFPKMVIGGAMGGAEIGAGAAGAKASDPLAKVTDDIQGGSVIRDVVDGNPTVSSPFSKGMAGGNMAEMQGPGGGAMSSGELGMGGVGGLVSGTIGRENRIVSQGTLSSPMSPGMTGGGISDPRAKQEAFVEGMGYLKRVQDYQAGGPKPGEPPAYSELPPKEPPATQLLSPHMTPGKFLSPQTRENLKANQTPARIQTPRGAETAGGKPADQAVRGKAPAVDREVDHAVLQLDQAMDGSKVLLGQALGVQPDMIRFPHERSGPRAGEAEPALGAQTPPLTSSGHVAREVEDMSYGPRTSDPDAKMQAYQLGHAHGSAGAPAAQPPPPGNVPQYVGNAGVQTPQVLARQPAPAQPRPAFMPMSDPAGKSAGGEPSPDPKHNEVSEALDATPAVPYRYKSPAFEPEAQRPGERQVGFLTSDLKKTPLGAAVVENRPDGFEGYNQHRMMGLQHAEIRNLHERMRQLESKLGGG